MVALQLLKAFVVKINLKNKNMESGLYKKYIGSPCKQEIDPKTANMMADAASLAMRGYMKKEGISA